MDTNIRNDKPKKFNSKRGSGGVVTLFEKEYEKYVFKIKSQAPDILWVKLGKKCFGLDKDLEIKTTLEIVISHH